MREIKFRAWSKEGKRMGYAIEKDDIFNKHLENKDFIIMQYTGLKDKNEKEIYEEDILQHKDGRIVIIGWSDIGARWSLYLFDGIDDEAIDKIREDFRCPGDGDSRDFEVIGYLAIT